MPVNFWHLLLVSALEDGVEEVRHLNAYNLLLFLHILRANVRTEVPMVTFPNNHLLFLLAFDTRQIVLHDWSWLPGFLGRPPLGCGRTSF